MILPLPFQRSLLHALLLSCCVAPGFAEEPVGQPVELKLTLRQAIDIALEKNPGLRQSANQVTTRSISVAQSKAAFAPALTATLSGAERFDKSFAVVDASRESRNYETAGGMLESTLNLFNGFADTAALRGAEWQFAGQQETFVRDEQTLVFSAVAAFLQVLSDRELIKVRTENLEGNRRQLEQVEALYQVGNRPVSDLYQQQSETAGAELDLLLAERNAKVSTLQLLKIMGLSPTDAVVTSPELESLEAALVAQNPEALNTGKLAWRADLQAGEKQVAAAQEQVEEARAGYWPTLNLFANINSEYSSLVEGSGFSEQFFDDNPAAAVGLILSVPIFDRQLTRHQVAQARIRHDDARLALQQQQLQAEAEFDQALEDFRTAQKLIGVTAARLTAARQALAAMEERYRVGAATLVELTQARALHTEAGFERVKARYGLITQGMALAYYQGDGERMQMLLARWENQQ